MRLALFALVLSTSAWASLLWVWMLAYNGTPQWETRIWFDDWARRGYFNEAWIEGALFVGGAVLNIVSAARLGLLLKRERRRRVVDTDLAPVRR